MLLLSLTDLHLHVQIRRLLIIYFLSLLFLEWKLVLYFLLRILCSFYLICESLKIHTFRFVNKLFLIWLLDFKFIKFHCESLRVYVLLKWKWWLYLFIINILKIYRLKKLVLFYLLCIKLKSQSITLLFLK